MAYAGGDRIKETCTNPGAGSFVLTGAVAGEVVRPFSSAEDGQYLRYLAKHSVAAESEVGAGLYTHATRTLTRLHRSYPSEGAGTVTFSSGTVHISNTPSVRDVVPFQSTSDPTTGDDIADGHIRGNHWINTTSGAVFVCVNPAPGAAVWTQINAGGGAVALGALTDVGTAPPTAGHLLQADGDSWEGLASTAVVGNFRGAGSETLATAFAALSGGEPFITTNDAADWSGTPFEVGLNGANKNENRKFTGNQNHQIRFTAANLADGDYGRFIRGGTGTVTLVYNDIPLNGGTANIGLKSKIDWSVHEGNVEIDGGTDEPVDMEAVVVHDLELRDYSETYVTQTGVTGGLTLDYAAAPHHGITHGAGNISGVTINNWPASGKSGSLTVDYKQDATGGRTVVHPTGIVWAGGTPTFNTAANKTNRVTYTTTTAGSVVVGHYGGAW